jgi:hypothetical protein
MKTAERYSMSVKDGARYFGIAEGTFYNNISNGELCPGEHYLKFGKKVLLLTEGIKAWIHEKSGMVYTAHGNS